MMTTPAEPPPQNGPAAPVPSEPWWKRAKAGPPPTWASPAAVRRLQLQRTTPAPRMPVPAPGDADGSSTDDRHSESPR